MQNFTLKTCTLLICLLLWACQKTEPKAIDTTSLSALQSLSNNQPDKPRYSKQSLSRVREMALKEMALSLGAQASLAKRADEINDALSNEARTLDTVFNFNALLLEHNVLPPVLLEGRNTLNLADMQNIRISDRTYKVFKQAQFVTTPPNWRQYLWMDYKKPDVPNVTILPKTPLEKDVWRKYLQKGWDNGLTQANTILEDNLSRIKEDFNGMILYRKLLAMNMVSAPFVSNTDLGVTGDGSEIHIDDRVLRITALPSLNTDASAWRAAVTKDRAYLNELNTLSKIANQTTISVVAPTYHPAIEQIEERKENP
jgi:defect-in-organelle-trafficking protein DotC